MKKLVVKYFSWKENLLSMKLEKTGLKKKSKQIKRSLSVEIENKQEAGNTEQQSKSIINLNDGINIAKSGLLRQ